MPGRLSTCPSWPRRGPPALRPHKAGGRSSTCRSPRPARGILVMGLAVDFGHGRTVATRRVAPKVSPLVVEVLSEERDRLALLHQRHDLGQVTNIILTIEIDLVALERWQVLDLPGEPLIARTPESSALCRLPVDGGRNTGAAMDEFALADHDVGGALGAQISVSPPGDACAEPHDLPILCRAGAMAPAPFGWRRISPACRSARWPRRPHGRRRSP